MRAASPRFIAEAAIAAALAVSGTALLVVDARPPPPRSTGLVAGPSTEPRARTFIGAAGTAALPPSVPVSLRIPAVGIDTPLIALGLQPDGSVAVPPLGRDSPAGWYRHGATPGAAGAAVILGHYDSARDGPAVFFRLRELTRGATIQIHRADGSTAVFAVTRVDRYRKDAFPTAAVYGPAERPVLRLVTCGGSFDRIRRSYRENLVVFADLATRPSHR